LQLILAGKDRIKKIKGKRQMTKVKDKRKKLKDNGILAWYNLT